MCTKSLKDLALLEITSSFAFLSVFRLGDISQNILSLSLFFFSHRQFVVCYREFDSALVPVNDDFVLIGTRTS